MSRLGPIVVVFGCCDGFVVSRFMGALPSGRYVPVVCPGPVSVLTCCGWWGSNSTVRVVGALWPSSSCSRPRHPHLYRVLCCH